VVTSASDQYINMPSLAMANGIRDRFSEHMADMANGRSRSDEIRRANLDFQLASPLLAQAFETRSDFGCQFDPSSRRESISAAFFDEGPDTALLVGEVIPNSGQVVSQLIRCSIGAKLELDARGRESLQQAIVEITPKPRPLAACGGGLDLLAQDMMLQFYTNASGNDLGKQEVVIVPTFWVNQKDATGANRTSKGSRQGGLDSECPP
jgi:hypothetical protein